MLRCLVGSVMCISDRVRTVGCVDVQAQKAGSYQHEHATAMRMAANLAANAVENVSLIEREQAKEEQLRQSQKMEAVGKLAGGIAHDFNNLLTAITGYSELTLRDLKTDTPLYSKVTEIKKAGERAASLTRQLLAFSRKQILQPKVLDLNAVIPDMEKMLQRLIGEDVVLETVLDRSLGQVKADPGQIEQIIMNLCVNARDAMPNGGRVTIETNNVSLNQAYRNQQVSIRAGNYVMLSVSDNGCGMDAETQARIFEPFFTTKELGKGTGLGLSTVYGIVKQSEGTIWVYSEVGKGTTFKIYLPRVDEAQSFQEHANKVSLASRGHETILIVEDEEIVLTLSTEILEKDGYRVLAAANGREGLRLCQEFDGPIDLLITDVVMPGMSGRELAELAANIRPDMHVLYMSGFTDDAIVRHGVLDDGVFFIQKPFSPDSLAIKTRSVLDHFGKTENRVGFDLEKTIGRDLGELNHGHTSVN
jgi:two-component system cell cycle sensor histidine kinase/response regulator CckA